MAANFSPPVASCEKQQVPEWIPPQTTKEKLEWADLRTIELSLLDSPDPEVVKKLVETTKSAIKEDGFLFLTNYGVSLEQLHRQFSLAQYLHQNISQEDKERLLWDPSTGVFAGFKPRFGWKREKGNYDGIEHFNFYSPEFEDIERVPNCIHPFMDEITAFCDYLMKSVNRRLLKLLSMVLELPDDYLWDNVQSHDGVVGDGYFRHALYYPLEGQHKASRKGVRMYGHTDYGTTTLLFSVPVTALQIWKEDRWKFVPYKPGALVINLGQTLEVISGGHFKATLHKVSEPPADQQHEQRLSLVFFNGSKGDMRLKPVTESPLIQREGFVLKQGIFMQFQRLMDAGIPVPTNKEWREAQISTRVQAAPEEKLAGVKDINGTKYGEDIILGVPILVPV
ncbi:Clavaminate synthase-like protein [Mollisia scopiformis]|uniref:Clavaminate synthase-like protein n=1 Tax=Mollisia scopiformis TaxID=149040 RepID=A0A194X3B0_MOLSC|nr:Clavaminate synthase-like protein [Mollisia scopiformis]KUJ14690.1 Clavaminate synthase-like protein [Mollisia scopiformis]